MRRWSVSMVPVKPLATRLEAGELDLAAVELLQVGRDRLVVVQDGVVVVALERDRHEDVLLVLGRHAVDARVGGFRCSEVTHPTEHLVRVILLDTCSVRR